MDYRGINKAKCERGRVVLFLNFLLFCLLHPTFLFFCPFSFSTAVFYYLLYLVILASAICLHDIPDLELLNSRQSSTLLFFFLSEVKQDGHKGLFSFGSTEQMVHCSISPPFPCINYRTLSSSRASDIDHRTTELSDGG